MSLMSLTDWSVGDVTCVDTAPGSLISGVGAGGLLILGGGNVSQNGLSGPRVRICVPTMSASAPPAFIVVVVTVPFLGVPGTGLASIMGL
jgi:hypothetical protein